MSLATSLAYRFGRLLPNRLDLESNTDCFYFLSERARSSKHETLEEQLIASAEWRYQYELRNRTLDNMFKHPIAPYLHDKTVLDFGCFVGGTTVAWIEQYGIRKAFGFDTEPVFADGANAYARVKAANAEFTAAYGEHLPYADESFDSIVSVDVFEHVKDVAACLRECKRVLRPGGHLLAMFPPYFNPMEHHLKITRMPFLHWIFSGETLKEMQNERFREYGDEAKHFIIDELNGYRSPYLNGVTVRYFQSLVREQGWTQVLDRRTGFPCMGETARSHPVLKTISALSTPFAHLPLLEEITLDHVVMILRKD